MSSQTKLAEVSGASSGIGAATALVLGGNGYQVIAGARRLDRLQELASKNSAIEVCLLDVTDQASVAAKFAERSLANTLHLELNGTPIRVTEIAPGMVKTDEYD